MQGIQRVTQPAPLPGTPASELIRAPVWELPVRVTHWLVFFSVVVLSFTGLYIHSPFLIAPASAATPFTMATIRFIHVTAAFVFTIAWAWRMYWFFVGNRCSRWSAFIPLQRSQWRGMRAMFDYYTFLRWYPTHRIGHNSLAAVAYLFMFTMMLVEILTGFAMYSRIINTEPVTTLFGWLPRLIDIQWLREIHYFVMFIFFAFTIHHVYSAVLVSTEERNGIIESIVTGYKYVPEWELTPEERACIPGLERLPAPPAPENRA